MNILTVTRAFYPAFEFGGPIPVTFNVTKRLVQRGHHVTVYTSNLLNPKKKLYKKTVERVIEGVRVVYLDSIYHYNWAAITPDILRYCHREMEDYDIVNIYGYRELMTLVVTYYAHRYQIPFVLQPFGNLPPFSRSKGKKYIYDSLFRHRLLGSADMLVAVSNLEAEQVFSYGIPKEKTAIIPNALDLAEYVELPSRNEFRQRYGISDSERIVLYLGRIAEIKNIDLLIKAFAVVHEVTAERSEQTKLKNLRLVIVGPRTEEAYFDSLCNLADDLGITEKILFTGPLNGWAKLAAFVDADVFVLPSLEETFGIAAIEALACGVPVVITERCGIAPLIRDKAGLVVQHNTDALCQAIMRILTDAKLCQTFKNNAKQLIQKEFSWESSVDKLESIFLELVNRSRG